VIVDYYNEFEPYATTWLRNLQAAELIPTGVTDDRSIVDVKPEELSAYRRVHFFAGISGWEYALQLAGWPEDLPVWTGSCPCQPFSICGKKKGEKDERHLWPTFLGLIADRRPPVVFGEQVASPAGRQWLAGVRADLEELGYRVGAADLCAAGVGAPHIRQRLYWVADTKDSDGWAGIRRAQAGARTEGVGRRRSPGGSPDGGLADAGQGGLQVFGQAHNENGRHASGDDADGRSQDGRMGDASSGGCGERGNAAQPRNGRHVVSAGRPGSSEVGLGLASGEGLEERSRDQNGRGAVRDEGKAARAGGRWSNYAWVTCRDGRTRRFEPGIFPLAHGVSCRMGKLRAYGNAIVPEVAATFIRAYKEVAGI
jgi:DNA (cytosine-5)-methyltransferase 1